MQSALDDAVKEMEGAADVEALAEEELLKAAQKIEQAARQLEEEASKRQKSATGPNSHKHLTHTHNSFIDV
jgi:exonuclease VII small subunit